MGFVIGKIKTERSTIVSNNETVDAPIISVSGGTSPYSYLWNNGNTTGANTSLLEGNYVVTVTDNNGCIKTTSCNLIDHLARWQLVYQNKMLLAMEFMMLK